MIRKRYAVILGVVLLGALALAADRTSEQKTQQDRPVYIGGGLNDEKLILFSTCLAASRKPAVLLIDTPKMSKPNQEFLKAYQATQLIPVGSFPEGVADLEQRSGMKAAPSLEWKRGPPAALWQELFPKAERVVICPAAPRRLLLQSAHLAAVLAAPLYISYGEPDEPADLRRRFDAWQTREVFTVAGADKLCRDIPNLSTVILADENAVRSACVTHQLKKGPIRTLVIANPADVSAGSMSTLAPWIAQQHDAVLLLTNDEGSNCREIVQAALAEHKQIQADFLILAAGLKAIPTEKRPNPIKDGKDTHIEMEPLTPAGTDPFTFATGRLFNHEPAMIALILARRKLLEQSEGPHKALIVSNPGDSLPLLETFSRHTANELRNNGYDTTALFGDDVSPEKMRKVLPEQDLFLWEGHYKTLIEKYEFLTWKEPLRPSLMFLQSCLALNESEVHPLYDRGAVGIVGTSTRTYSGTGGAFTLAFFNALLYDDLPLGAALRQSKNFLLAYTLLKEKRLDGGAKLSGVNLRSAWAFTLWGDPTLKLPRPKRPADALAGVRHEVKRDQLTVYLPETSYEMISVGDYEARMRPNARLAGLITPSPENEDKRKLLPFIFAEVKLRGPEGKTPHLSGKTPEKNWVFLWDKARSTGYLLVTPRGKSQNELRFKITWDDAAE